MKLEELYIEIQPKIYAFFYVQTLHKEAAEDLTHEVFYQALKSAHSFSGASTISTWLFSIAKNVLKKYYRTKKYQTNLQKEPINEKATVSSPETDLLKKEVQKRVLEEINKLDDLSKEVVTLRIYGELSFLEISEIIGKSENYARVTFHRAKLKLQKKLEGYHGQ
ncbi:sigma-70 family RNA polymerase sigma factor [Bacillaceae bacterium Marseille-Q3522]|nr:sigma-70 family RNA polymerase sigma factor [Bacillaceae bacterium Marseille-Q3522]